MVLNLKRTQLCGEALWKWNLKLTALLANEPVLPSPPAFRSCNLDDQPQVFLRLPFLRRSAVGVPSSVRRTILAVCSSAAPRELLPLSLSPTGRPMGLQHVDNCFRSNLRDGRNSDLTLKVTTHPVLITFDKRSLVLWITILFILYSITALTVCNAIGLDRRNINMNLTHATRLIPFKHSFDIFYKI